jgi:hypothetical protein
MSQHNYNSLTLRIIHINLLFTEAVFSTYADNSYLTTHTLLVYSSYLTLLLVFYLLRIFPEPRYITSAPTAQKTQLYCWLVLTAQKTSRGCYCCVATNWGYVVLSYCWATQYLSRNLATRGARGREGRQDAAALCYCCAIAFLEVSEFYHLPHGVITPQYPTLE